MNKDLEQKPQEAEKSGAFVLESLSPDSPLPILRGLHRSKGQSWLEAVGSELASSGGADSARRSFWKRLPGRG